MATWNSPSLTDISPARWNSINDVLYYGLNCELIRVFLVHFKQMSDIIVANRITDDIRDVFDKVYSRDLFGKD